ncbi:glucosaminidase domain-containing protein [Treponema brennaborense]|nr:glucosaminidase domain-containing protein [Treponema brennaborense]
MKNFSAEPAQSVPISRRIDASGMKSAAQLCAFFLSQNPDADGVLVSRLASYYVEECAAERINSDVAFVQMCLETGFLRFGGLVTPDMHNYCGLGAIDASRPGERFPTERLGVRAHVQHLHAYGTTVPLKGALVDPRYKYVNPRGKAPDVWALAGTWAADVSYGTKLDALLGRLEVFY